MGVTGLWRLIDASGKPVPLESLEGKVLAIDISIWIHQVLQGYQDKRGNAVPNAHLLGLYHRICKLLYFKIKPVFVFDGGVPLLKKNTIAARKKQKALAAGKAEKMKNDLLLNLMKHSLVKNILPNTSKDPTNPSDSSKNLKSVNDMFKLPPTSLQESFSDSTESDSDETSPRKQSKWRGNIHSVDITTDDFKSLPADVRFDILTDLKETRKQNSWGKLHEIPEESHHFSNYQMKRLLKRRQAQEFLEVAEQEMGGKTLTLEELEKLMADQGIDTSSKDLVHRIASDETTRMIYINDLKAQKVNRSDSGIVEDLSQPGCSKDLNKTEKLAGIPEESVLENIGDYDLEDWDDDVEFLEEFRTSPVVKRFFGKVPKNNPAIAYMMENSELSQEQILKLIEESKESVRKAKAEERLKRKKMTPGKGSGKIKKVKIDDFDIREFVEVKEEIESPEEISDDEEKEEMSGIEELKKKSGIGSDKKISSDSDSDDFIEVQEVPVLKSEKKMEILIKPSDNIEDDLFADVFEKKNEVEVVSSDFVDELKVFDDIIKDQRLFSEEEMKESDKNVEKKSSTPEKSKDPSIIEENGSGPVIDVDLTVGDGSESFGADLDDEKVPEDVETEVKAQELSQTQQNGHEKGHKIGLDSINQQNSHEEDHNINLISKNQQNTPEEDHNIISDSINQQNTHQEAHKIDLNPQNPQNHHQKSPTPPQESPPPPEKPSTRITDLISRLESEKPHLLSQISTPENLESLQTELETETDSLKQNIGKLDRQSIEVTEQMRSDAQDLLRLFGIPYIVAPQEAEAQCAYLEAINLTDGSITDDSDIWLFGGRCVYRNFFNNAKRVMQYLSKDIEHHFKLTRQQMIQLALLVGSDYTVGIPGIGPVTAMEIIASFPSQGDDLLRGLTNFSSWMRGGRVVGPGKATLRNKLKNIVVDRGFPSQAVVQAYLFPTVDESKETFSWGKPNLVLLGDYTREKFGWTKAKFEETMGPVMKRLEAKSQKDLMAYFKVKSVPKGIEGGGLSKRVQKAVEKLGKGVGDDDDEEEMTEKVRKRRKGGVRKGKGHPGEGEDVLVVENVHEDVPDDADEDKKEKKSKITKEVIPQREKDRQNALNKKLKAIEVFRKSRKGPGKSKGKSVQLKRKTISKEAELSESSSDDD